ncbi:hypothetical protein [Nonomuraea indica]|uniref:hypothetical protein n=1 Tax=Nonomuraea indica TaxID=1581193 RepID=UPI001183BDF4|nr:hypothetical protein [Nonomuraea indica]
MDEAAGGSVSLRPAALYHYRYGQEVSGPYGKVDARSVTGLALLDTDGLVLLDLPGAWDVRAVRGFAEAAGLPVVAGPPTPSGQVRALLSGRAPGWRRMSGLPRPRASRWRLPLAVCAGVTGLAVMTYLALSGAWQAWRGLASLGRLALDLLDAKWLAVAFSPLLLIARPLAGRLHHWRNSRGTVLGPPGGPYLQVKKDLLHLTRGRDHIRTLLLARARGSVAGLLLYRHAANTGLVITTRAGRPLHHLPGPWPPEDVHRFAARHGLELRVCTLSREEYVTLLRSCPDACP